MRIAIVSGSRADRNALEMVRRALVAEHDIAWVDLSHPAAAWSERVPVRRTERAMSLTVLHLWRPDEDQIDLVVLHGDRHEILGAAVAANVMGIPIAHIGGGDITEGSADDCYRHAITKLAHLHFASNQGSADRIVQMGEQPDRVHVTGCPGLDMVAQTPVLTRDETFAAVGLKPCDRLVLVSFHPNTMGDTKVELDALSGAINDDRSEATVLIGPNADAGSDLIRAEWIRLAEKNEQVSYYETLAPQVFYSLMKHCSVMVGNSSAGLYEAPMLGTWVINIGDRQKGRQTPSGVFNCAPEAGEISSMIGGAIKLGKGHHTSSVYGDGHAAARIAQVIGGVDDPKGLLRKRFNDLTEFIPEPVLRELPF